MTRKEKKTYSDKHTAAFFTVDTILEIWGTNSTLQETKAKLEVTAFDLHSDWSEKFEKSIVLGPNSSTELFKGDLPGELPRANGSEIPKTIIVSARLIDAAGHVLARYSNW
jgi:beta-mannosidase